MSLLTEQQNQVDLAIAIAAVHHTNQLAILAEQAKQDAMRIASQILIENARSKPANEREITSTDITAFANTLLA